MEKKKALVAAERDEDARQLWRDDTRELDPTRAIFVDECGTHRALTPLYAWAPRAERAVGRVPRNRGRATTLLSSLTLAGVGPSLTIEGGVDAAVFAAYAEQLLAPALAAGDVVDHGQPGRPPEPPRPGGDRGARRPRAAAAALLAGLDPDRVGLRQGQGGLRRAEARTHEALEEAIGQALRTVTPQDAHAWFAHCGYPLPAQPLRPP